MWYNSFRWFSRASCGHHFPTQIIIKKRFKKGTKKVIEKKRDRHLYRKEPDGTWRKLTKEEYMEWKYGRLIKSDLIEEIQDGEYSEYVEEYWDYEDEYN